MLSIKQNFNQNLILVKHNDLSYNIGLVKTHFFYSIQKLGYFFKGFIISFWKHINLINHGNLKNRKILNN